MAKGKYVAKRAGTMSPSAGAGGGAAPAAVSSATSPLAASSSRSAGTKAELPALGIAVMSPWGWRILTVFTMVALGLCVTFFLDGHTVFGAVWVVIAGGWGVFSYRLWRMHLAWDAG
jgi:hypothetical protein